MTRTQFAVHVRQDTRRMNLRGTVVASVLVDDAYSAADAERDFRAALEQAGFRADVANTEAGFFCTCPGPVSQTQTCPIHPAEPERRPQEGP